MTNEEIGALVRKVRKGDGSAFGDLYEATYKAVFFHAGTVLKNNEDIEDAVQEAYTQAYQNIDKLNAPEAFASWVNQIATYVSLRKIRKGKNKTVYSIDDEDFFLELAADPDTMPDEIAEKQSTQAFIGGLIQKLPEAQRLAMVMFYYDGLSVKDIAREMGCSENTVKSRLYYGRMAIKADLEEEERKTGVRFYGLSNLSLRRAIAWLIEHTSPLRRSVLTVGNQLVQLSGTAHSLASSGVGASTMLSLGKTLAPVAMFFTTYRKQILAGLLALLGVGGVATGVSFARGRQRPPEPIPTVLVSPSPSPSPTPAPTPTPTPTPTP
ncbi:MAG: sigma-70 family RNA polymerase sigma factor, partial [Oscillospiraceae bacterium]|nr:sigma-70 family RNA polymerase sigma factor [Oscillospiraceae bacterium]